MLLVRTPGGCFCYEPLDASGEATGAASGGCFW